MQAILPDPLCPAGSPSIFVVGGAGPGGGTVLVTEVWRPDRGAWQVHRSLPQTGDHVMQTGAASGCFRNRPALSERDDLN